MMVLLVSSNVLIARVLHRIPIKARSFHQPLASSPGVAQAFALVGVPIFFRDVVLRHLAGRDL